MKPAEVGLGGGPAISVLVQPRDGAVIDNLALLVAPAAIDHLALGDLRDVSRDDSIDQLGGVAPSDQVFEQRGDVDERGGIADGVVLVLMMHFVGADGVVSRPLAVIKALAQREGAFVKSSGDGHEKRPRKSGMGIIAKVSNFAFGVGQPSYASRLAINSRVCPVS